MKDIVNYWIQDLLKRTGKSNLKDLTEQEINNEEKDVRIDIANADSDHKETIYMLGTEYLETLKKSKI